MRLCTFLFLVWIEVSVCIGYAIVTECILHSAAVYPVSVCILCHGNIIALVIIKTVGAAAGITSCVSTGIAIVSIVAIISVVAVIISVVAVIISVVAVIISAVVIWIIIAVIIGYTILTKGVNNAVSIYPVSVAVFINCDQISLIVIETAGLSSSAVVIVVITAVIVISAVVVIIVAVSTLRIVGKACTVAVCDTVCIKIINRSAAVYPVSVAVLIDINCVAVAVINILTVLVGIRIAIGRSCASGLGLCCTVRLGRCCIILFSLRCCCDAYSLLPST